MQLRILALFAIFAVSAWLPYAAQQTSTPRAAPESQSPAGSPAARNGLANSTCAPCDHAKYDAKRPPGNHQAHACCHGNEVTSTTCCRDGSKDTKPAMNCSEGKDTTGPSIPSTKDGKACCARNGKCCCQPEDGKPCCANKAMACNSKHRKACGASSTEQCCASADGK